MYDDENSPEKRTKAFCFK